jgi:hypothetical protein
MLVDTESDDEANPIFVSDEALWALFCRDGD